MRLFHINSWLVNIGLKLSKCRGLIYHLFSRENATLTDDLIVRFLLELESGNRNVEDRQMEKKRQTKGWNYAHFKNNLAMIVICLPVKFEFDWTKHF